MTIQEHIEFLINQADEDLGVTEAIEAASYYGQALFWGHLVLEKLCKALYLKNNNKTDYPYIHNLLVLMNKCNVELNDEQIAFYSDMNRFQSKGRYGDTLHEIDSTITKEVCENYIDKLKTEMIWLKKQLQ